MAINNWSLPFITAGSMVGGAGLGNLLWNIFGEREVKVSNLGWKFIKDGRETASFVKSTSLGHLKDCITLSSNYDSARIDAFIQKRTLWQALTLSSSGDTYISFNKEDQKRTLQQIRCIERCNTRDEFTSCVQEEKFRGN